MKILFYRFLPLLSALLAFAAANWQWQHASSYPFPLALSLLWTVAAILLIGWSRLSWSAGLEKMLPTVIALVILGFGFLVAEDSAERWTRTILFAGIPFLALELFFLAAFDPARYPVNGLSRLNLALVPFSAFFFTSTLNGLFVFVRIPWYTAPLGLMLFGAVFYFFTSHPTATDAQKRHWGWLGGLIGLHAGLLSLLLPVAMAVHGAIVALMIAFPLRLRRYAYQPVPSEKLAWAEGTLALVLFAGLLLVSRWA